jgi:putative membrane protein
MSTHWQSPVVLDLKSLEGQEHAVEVQTPVVVPEEAVFVPIADSEAVIKDEVVGSRAQNDSSEFQFVAAASSRGRGMRWFWLSLLAFLLLLGSYESVILVRHIWYEQAVIGVLLGGLLAIMLVAGGWQIWRLWKSLQQIKTVSLWQQRALAMEENSADGAAHQMVAEIRHYYEEQAIRLDHWTVFQRQLDNVHANGEALDLFSTNVMSSLDKRAQKVVVQRASEAGVMVAMSPLAFLDMLLVLWRNTQMIREIAAIYGFFPGRVGQWWLLRRVFHNLLYAGVSELVSDAGAELLGGKVSAVVSAKMAQGVGVGVFTARLGLQTMKLCRPLPYRQDVPRLSDIRREIMASVKSLLFKKS